jgi:uncharacterized protein YdeI (YjbR/CyaY-like superfamily)
LATLLVTNPIFFATPLDFGAWLAEHHDSVAVQWVGFYKKATGKPSITWEESVDEALCWGWIDGLRKSIDDESYAIRFTPRKPGSVWSARNIERVAVLRDEGRMQPPGLAAYEHHDQNPNPRSGYRTSEFSKELPEAMLAEIRANPKAWEFYESQSTGYRRHTTRWIMSAKREETRARRLATLIADAARGLKIKQLREG